MHSVSTAGNPKPKLSRAERNDEVKRRLFDAAAKIVGRLGYAEGRDVDVDYRNAVGNVERLKPLAQELIALKPDILVASSPSAARVSKTVAPTLPIVCLALTDAVIPDLIASYARPGGMMQSTKVSLTINLKTAKALGLEVPITLQAGADEVIE